MDIDEEKTTEIALAVLSLTEHKVGPTTRAWKTVDWSLLETMHQKDWILDPKGKSKSIALTNEGAGKAAEFRRKHLSNAHNNTELLTELEHGLWQGNKRYDKHWFQSVLHPAFVEIGRSGRKYHYVDMFPVSSGEINCQMPLPHFDITFPTSDTALITYESHVQVDGEILSARRTSLWVNENEKWLLRQHQGTPFNPTPDPT